ncbi:porin family protein [uncultured Tenacibaculum sp.]|uniref:porin family protein n=1 Tax=uncultured Tenacibaculum sp. TaxID=174713 RepID=UPI00261A300A|nr:porin family protein [uncultured Tenacibaculum sp.]
MKRILFSIVMIAFGFLANAQGETTYGVIGGFNNLSAKVSAGGASTSFGDAGAFVGLFIDFELSEKFKLQPEFQYVITFFEGDSGNSIVLPVMAKYYISNEFSVQAGPFLDLILDGTSLNEFGLGLAGGVGYDFTDDFFATARYSFGLTDRRDSDIVSTKFDFFQIGLGYRF